MKCQEVHSLIPAYFQGQVDEYTKIKIHHHLAGCTNCTEDFHMWRRGDELIQTSSQEAKLDLRASSPTLVMDQVMQRIKQEEKWANPSVKSESTYKRSSRRALMLAACTLMLFFAILVTSTFMPQKEVYTGDMPLIMEQVETSWEKNTIVLFERTVDQETSMNFQVASFHDPLIYALPIEEGKSGGHLLIFSIFGLLCIIISLSWITRV